MRLHVLTPLSEQNPSSLAGDYAAPGDWIVDLCHFPPTVWEIDAGSVCLDVTVSLLPTRDYWTIVREWLVNFTSKTGLQDVLQIDGYGFWWTLNAQMFVPGLSQIGDAFAWIDALKAIQERARPSGVMIYGDYQPIIQLVGQVCPDAIVEVRSLEKKQNLQSGNRLPRRLGLLIARILLGVVYLLYTMFRHPDICFLSNTRLVRQTWTGSKRELRDVYMGDIVQAVRRRGRAATVVEKYSWGASWERLKARGFFFPSDVIYFWVAIRRKLGLYRRSVHRWHQEWQTIRPTLFPHLRYQGYDVSLLILPLVEVNFKRYAIEIEGMVRVWQCILSNWRPSLLYVNNAYGPAGMTAVIAAKILDISTNEQQHGVIGRNHFAYLVPRELETRVAFPLCDTMTLWGPHIKRFLAQANAYRSDQLVVCGSPRIDRMLKTKHLYDDVRKHLGISVGAPIALYTSNKFARAFITTILDSITHSRARSDVHWIVKLHPSEETRAIWQQEIAKRGLLNVVVVREEFEFHTLLMACDVHITFASTTLIESAVLGKLNLGLVTPNAPDPAGYREAGAFLPVAPQDVALTVSAILSDPEQQNRLRAAQRSFAQDWCLHDGQSVDRIVAHIEAVVASREKS